MTYLIDGHNLIPQLPGFSLQAADDENRLISLVQAFCRQQRRRAELFFDGAPAGQSGRRSIGGLPVHFVSSGTTADRAIEARLRQLGRAARNYIVVSSDRQVQAAARSAQAAAISSQAFAAKLLASAPPPAADEKPASPGDIEEWLELFKSRAKPRS